MISREEIESLATLARLKLSSGEVEALQKDISNILEYVGQVGAVTLDRNKSAALPYRLPAGRQGRQVVHNVMRDDAPREPGDQLAGKEAALRAAFPKEKNGFNAVRKIIQKDE